MTVCYYHVTYAIQSESTLYSCLNVKEILAQSRRKIWSLSDCNWIWTHNHLVRKRTLNHLADLAKWLSVPLRTNCLWVRVQLQSLNYARNLKFDTEVHTHTLMEFPKIHLFVLRLPSFCWCQHFFANKKWHFLAKIVLLLKAIVWKLC